MYYVIQVAPGMEERTEILIQKRVGNELYDCCFHPIRHVRKKFHGEWRDQHEKLLAESAAAYKAAGKRRRTVYGST